MDTSKKVSIIMAIYNCASTLEEAIDSILNQTYTNWELIMCDDGSADNTYAVAKKYADKYADKITLIRNESNKKLPATLNHCLKYVTGEYIARMDGDDISAENRFERQVDFLNNNPQYIVVGTAMIPFDDEGNEYGVRKCENCFDVNKKRQCFHGTIMCRKEMYDRLGGYCEKWYAQRSEDQYLWYSLSSNKDMLTYNLDEPLYRVRENTNTYGIRRNLKNAFTISICLIHCYKMMKFPLRKYINVLRPYACAIMPASLMRDYHDKQDKRN